MRKFLIAAFAISGLALAGANLRADDAAKGKDKKDEGVKGVLIDKKCGTGMKDEKAAADHKMSCALACKDSGLGVFHKDKWIEFDGKGQELALKYLSDKKNTSTKVHVEGKVSDDGKKMAVTAIHAQDEKDGAKKDDAGKEEKHEEGDKKEG